MEGRSFAAALLGAPSSVSDSLAFPDDFHKSFSDPSSTTCPFIKQATFRYGLPSIDLSAGDTNVLADFYKFTLVGKFTNRPPTLEAIRNELSKFNLASGWKTGFLDNRHIMIHFVNEEDYAKLFAKRLIRMEGLYMKLLKWTPYFDFKHEPPFSPVWIKLPYLRLHLFHKQLLFSIGAIFGKPLKVDLPTSNLSRPSCARILVEMDILAEYPAAVWIGSDNEGYWQQVTIENIPHYCTTCKMFGHPLNRCFIHNPELRQNNTSARDPQQQKLATQDQIPTATQGIVPVTLATDAHILPAVFHESVRMNAAVFEQQELNTNLNSGLKSASIHGTVLLNSGLQTELFSLPIQDTVVDQQGQNTLQNSVLNSASFGGAVLPNSGLHTEHILLPIPDSAFSPSAEPAVQITPQANTKSVSPIIDDPIEKSDSLVSISSLILKGKETEFSKRQISAPLAADNTTNVVVEAPSSSKATTHTRFFDLCPGALFTTEIQKGLTVHDPDYDDSIPDKGGQLIHSSGGYGDASMEDTDSSLQDKFHELERFKDDLDHWNSEWSSHRSRKKQHKGARELKGLSSYGENNIIRETRRAYRGSKRSS